MPIASLFLSGAVLSFAPEPVVEPDPVVAPAPEPAPAPAAPPPHVDVAIDIGLFPSLSINGSHKGRKVKNSLSFALGWTRAAKLEGIAAAGFATIVDEEARGVTWSLGANIARGSHHGLQVTHGYNHADVLRGVQSGAINHARQVTGLQVGMLNVGGTVRGAQFGLINYAEEADASFALLPITQKGGVHPEVWTSDTALLNVGIRLPAKYTYAFVAAGLHPIDRRASSGDVVPLADAAPTALYYRPEPERRGRAMELGVGFGGHIPAGKAAFVEADLSVYGVTSGLNLTPPFANLTKLRLMAGWQAAERLAVYGGPTLNLMVDDVRRPVDRPGYGWVAASHTRGEYRLRFWPGFAAGVRF